MRINDAGYVRCVSDMCLYHKRNGEEMFAVGFYVDDPLATGTRVASGEKLFMSLASLSIKDLGQVHKLLVCEWNSEAAERNASTRRRPSKSSYLLMG